MKQWLIQLLTGMVLIGAGASEAHAETAAGSSEPVFYYDFSSRSEKMGDEAHVRSYYDEIMILTALQGLVNRDAPRLFVRHLAETDDFWWEQMSKPGDWLEGREIRKAASLDELLEAHPKAFKGLVVWDESVAATSNVALSMAGLEDLLPVRYDPAQDSWYSRLTKRGIEPKVWLIKSDGTPLFTGNGTIPGTETRSSGSSKNDAYRWLLHHYGSKLDPERISYHLDSFWLKAHTAAPAVENAVPNGDYFVAHRAIRCDLHVLEDEAPIDDPTQKPGTDLETLKMILLNANERLGPDRMIQFAGFTPWAHKYSDAITNGWNPGGKQGPLNSEQRLAEIITAHNAFMDGDAPNLVFMANASFYMHYPVPAVVPQTAPKPTRERLIEEGILDKDGKIKPLNFYTYYTGDYDAAPWLLRMAPRLWNDPARGQIPISWAFNPNLADRFAYGMMWLRKNATKNDFFVSGDSGAGYVNPSRLKAPRIHSDLPDAMDRWAEHSGRYFTQWDLNVTGFIIDGTAPAMGDEGWDMYRRFSPGGVVVQGMERPFGTHRGVPYLVMGPGVQEVNDPKFVARLLGTYFQPEGYSFTIMRTIIVQAPTLYQGVDEILKANAQKPSRPVDLATLLWLIQEHATHPEKYPAPPSFEEAEAVSVDPLAPRGLSVRLGGEDGVFEEVEAGPKNSAGWKMLSPYLYFDVDNGFARSLSGPVEMELTYLDEGSGEFGLEFDSATTPYQIGNSQKLQNSGAWKTASFVLPQPQFSNRQNGGNDFRINNRTSQKLVIRSITIRRAK